jgi:hypothetical protein
MSDRSKVVTYIINSVAERELDLTIKDIIDQFGTDDVFHNWELSNKDTYKTSYWHIELVKSLLMDILNGYTRLEYSEQIKDFIQSEMLKELSNRNKNVGLMLLCYAEVLDYDDMYTSDAIIDDTFNKVLNSLTEEVVSRFNEIEDLIKRSL